MSSEDRAPPLATAPEASLALPQRLGALGGLRLLANEAVQPAGVSNRDLHAREDRASLLSSAFGAFRSLKTGSHPACGFSLVPLGGVGQADLSKLVSLAVCFLSAQGLWS